MTVMKYLAALCALGVIFGLCNGLVRLVIILSWIATATPLNFMILCCGSCAMTVYRLKTLRWVSFVVLFMLFCFKILFVCFCVLSTEYPYGGGRTLPLS